MSSLKNSIVFILLFSAMISAAAQTKVTYVDLDKFSGKWYVIATIPTSFDGKWRYVTETYSLNKKGNIDIFTTYKKNDLTKEKSVGSKGFPVRGKANVAWKVQFVWPFKADYLIEELADDYTYVVVGHPKKKFLYIMNRSGKMSETQFQEIRERFGAKGYDLSELLMVEQGF